MTSVLERSTLLKSQAFVGGAWVDADDGATFPVYDPATGERIADVPRFGANETRRAIEAANAALPAWRAKTGKERAALVRRWYELIVEHTEELAHIMTLEQGKPLAEARGEIAMGAGYVEWNAEEAKRIYGDTIPTLANDRRMVVVKQPIGVCVGITPWNFPHAMVTRKASPAIAAGCTFVLKPAEQTPLSALAVAALAEMAGLPAGVFNVVTGDATDAPVIGEEMTSNPIVRKLGFTGSTAVGKLLMAQCARTVKKVSLELGGNAPFIVFDDADVDAAVNGAMAAKFRNAGQVCVSPNRLFVQSGIHDAFVQRLAERVRTLRTGNGFEDGVQIGPLIEDQGFAKVVEHVDDACAHGARLVTGGASKLGGTFFEPTVLTNVNATMRLSHEETFGPVAAIASFKTEAEVIATANDTPYGLASYFYSRDIGRVWRVAEALETGMVGINTPMLANEAIPFGGVKESGIGREGSKYGIEEWTEIKYLCFGGLDT
ncbi:NAD-dependent succinate-semialdehyde dehydrogenase [Vulcanimicrobium alpinum]|uniref:NAD-dependent succinate-semialdehyde dehydrogenase n=1 Tax=Vulcanimicrobium alpinum TaxID=3016050 RepID=A0AAN2CBP1_UNVUL|nr:NAD-dependent succinate-semialdehyde dehydrogenase [Vulcanimicrobium alpinum]BDE08052.1 NAD-dependent succinate-semialdehyde dehydrogenase [Vulcanimicrobium alpinum]